MARLLGIMGSGETSPTMSRVHRDLFDRLGPGPVPAVLLDTPVGFQENADDIAARARAYFHESVGRELEVASWRSADDSDPVTYESMVTQLRRARYVFSGPGSPSYALRQWRGSQVPAVLADKLRPGGDGGCITFASAAAVTLGRVALPVYEIYKVGEAPRWLDGLDLLASLGLSVAVIPHYNNAEGGTHDTRYCYMGERRLRILEALLPDGTFVLGVDEHTACILDLDAGTMTVAGLGAVTVRRAGTSTRFEAASVVAIDALRDASVSGAGGASGAGDAGDAVGSAPVPGEARPPTHEQLAVSPLLGDVARCEQSFDEALAAGDARGAVKAVLELDDVLHDWATDTLQSDELDRGRSVLRSLIVRLGDVAEVGVRDRREVVGPFVDPLLQVRERARRDRRFDEADAVRDALTAAGVEVRDTPQGPEWGLLS